MAGATARHHCLIIEEVLQNGCLLIRFSAENRQHGRLAHAAGEDTLPIPQPSLRRHAGRIDHRHHHRTGCLQAG